MDPNRLPDIPHFYVDQKRTSPLKVGLIILVSFLVLTIPVGVYFMNQSTSFFPKASENTPFKTLEAGLVASTNTTSLNTNQEFKVDINFNSELDEVNLVKAKIKFTQNSLEVVRIERSPSFAKQWFEYAFDNSQGTVSLMGASPNPGSKTSKETPYLTVATVVFKTVKPDLASISFEEQDSGIYRNSDNSNILKKVEILTLNINGTQDSEIKSPKQPGGELPIEVTSPAGGRTYSFYEPVQISWNPKGVAKILAVSLYMNGENFGRIESNLDPKLISYPWKPEDTLLLPYITPQNSFQVLITAVSNDGKVMTGFNEGPFGISANTETLNTASSSAAENTILADLNGDNSIDASDASVLFSNFGLQSPKNLKADINGDGKVGEIDYWLMRKILLSIGYING